MSGSVVIVGGGLAGLATGIHAQQNGYRVTLLERNAYAGGVCTAWERDGFEFDGCIRWLMGAAPGSPLHELYRRTGALDHVQLEPIQHLTTHCDEGTDEQ
ncbi:MAG: FAD-dependent oxidoreductase, partial [Myxococcota bacterium]